MQPGVSPAPEPASAASDLPVRRMPRNAPHIDPGDAVIRNSGSTNTAGFLVVVHPDYSADVYFADEAEHKSVGAPQAKWLFEKLQAAMPLGDIGAAHCMKSASFGSSTTIAYEGQMTPDLSCAAGNDAARELARTAAVIVNQIGIPSGLGRPRRRLL
jgi:hypothetical protein